MTTTEARRRLRPSELEGKPLGEHDGVQIVRTAAKITKAGDGLSESLHMAPLHLPMGGEVVVVVPCRVVSHEYDFARDGRDVVESERVETAVLQATGALFVDPDLVDGIIEDHLARVTAHREEQARLRREAKGEYQLPMDDGRDDDDDETDAE